LEVVGAGAELLEVELERTHAHRIGATGLEVCELRETRRLVPL
jgi:hypothetical protein